MSEVFQSIDLGLFFFINQSLQNPVLDVQIGRAHV